MQHHIYSRMVGILKIVLPLLALAVLGTVFLITSDDSFEPGFNFTQADFDALGSGSYLDNAQINGTTEKGDVFSLSAERIEPDSAKMRLLTVTNLTSNFDFLSGASVTIVSILAELDNIKQILVFPSGARILTSDGYAGTLSILTANLQTGNISGEMIDVIGPLGQISAEKFHISGVTIESAENQVLSFEKDVKVILNTQVQTE